MATLQHFGFFDQTQLGKASVLLAVSFQNGPDVAQIAQGCSIVTLLSVVGKLWNCDCHQNTNCGDYDHDFDKGKSSTKYSSMHRFFSFHRAIISSHELR